MSIEENIYIIKLFPIPDVGEYPTSGMGVYGWGGKNMHGILVI